MSKENKFPLSASTAEYYNVEKNQIYRLTWMEQESKEWK